MKYSIRSFAIHVIIVTLIYCVIMIITIINRKFIESPFLIAGPAMHDTLRDGEIVMANARAYQNEKPARGDIVVFHPPYDPTIYLIERIIGLPGETIIIRGGDVHVLQINEEQELPETYLGVSAKGKTYACGALLDTGSVSRYVVPEDHYFILGDNRTASLDSRCFQNEGGQPYVHQSALYGKVTSVRRNGETQEIPAALYQRI